MNLARLDDEDVAGGALELSPVDRPPAAPLTDELNLVVRVPVRPWAGAGFCREEEDGDVDVALIGTDELMRAANERQWVLTNAVHSS